MMNLDLGILERINSIIESIDQDINLSEYIFQYETTSNSTTCAIYECNKNTCRWINDDKNLLKKYSNLLNEHIKGIGVLVLHKVEGAELKLGYIPKYNTELSFMDLSELINYQEFNIKPAEEERKERLKKSIKAEKIKKTLVYAAYMNDTFEIIQRAANASKNQLNKKMTTKGTPLGLCAQFDNLEGFIAIAEAGADIGKKSIASTPLELAFRYSPEIVKYIKDNFKEQFEKEVKKKGFSIAAFTKDIELLRMLLDYGCEMDCDGSAFPPLHSFADFDNEIGVRFFIENGANLEVLNKYKQTALDRAKRMNSQACISLLQDG